MYNVNYFFDTFDFVNKKIVWNIINYIHFSV